MRDEKMQNAKRKMQNWHNLVGDGACGIGILRFVRTPAAKLYKKAFYFFFLKKKNLTL